MSSITIIPEVGLAFGGDAVSSRHLGANFLFNRESFNEGVGTGGFDEITARLGVQHLRYPGGTITERQFDPTRPDNPHQAVDLITGTPLANANQHALTPLSDFLSFASDAGARVSIVLPSYRYADAILSGDTARIAEIAQEIRRFVEEQLSTPHRQTIEAFEIGNEWSAIGFSTAADYGVVADRMAIWIAEGIAASGIQTDPKIAVQASLRAARLSETEAIAAQLSPAALDAIDAVILHNYRPFPWAQGATTAAKFDHVAVFEDATGRALETFVTEWNVANGSDADGLLQAAGILSMFGQMMRLGMDLGHIWPVFENNTTRLAGDVTAPEETADLMIGGEIFRQMTQSLPGLRSVETPEAVDLDRDGTPDLLVQVYAQESEDGAVLFLSSLSGASQRVDATAGALASIVSPGAPVWMTRTGVADSADPVSPFAMPDIHAVSMTHRFPDGWTAPLVLDLDPYETLRLEFSGPALSVSARHDSAARDDFRTDLGTEVFVLLKDEHRDLIRTFDPLKDRLDVSDWGARGVTDLVIEGLVRRDGSISWVEIGTDTHDTGVLLRFADGAPTEASRLTADHFIFAAETPAPERLRIEGTNARDDFRLTPDAETLVLRDDGVRDTIRDFDPSLDRIDLSAFALNGFEDLDLVNLLRRDGSVSWVALIDADGEAEAILRTTTPTLLDAGQITADSFIL